MRIFVWCKQTEVSLGRDTWNVLFSGKDYGYTTIIRCKKNVARANDHLLRHRYIAIIPAQTCVVTKHIHASVRHTNIMQINLYFSINIDQINSKWHQIGYIQSDYRKIRRANGKLINAMETSRSDYIGESTWFPWIQSAMLVSSSTRNSDRE